MCIRHTISFEKIPNIASILAMLNIKTGIRILFLDREFEALEYNMSVEIEVNTCGNKIYVNSFQQKVNYIEGHLINVLIELGGKYEGQLPSFINLTYPEYLKLKN